MHNKLLQLSITQVALVCIAASSSFQMHAMDRLDAEKKCATLRVELSDSIVMPLHAAAIYNLPADAQKLLARGDDINAKACDETTPLMFAAMNGYLTMVQLLLNHNANPSLKSYSKKTASDWAHKRGHFEIAAILLEAEGKFKGKEEEKKE